MITPFWLSLYLPATLVILVYMTIMYLLSLLLKRADIADIAWGPGFVLVLLASAIAFANLTPRVFLVLTLVGIWAARLAFHIYSRNRGKSEDYRYAAWRRDWGDLFLLRSYLQIFLLQGLFLLVISTPLLYIARFPSPDLDLWAYLGVAIWLFGFYFESLADYQLAQFKSDPANKGKIITSGLWRYSRHPNYFGEAVQWWGIYLLAVGLPAGWLTFIGPLTITILVRYVSGVPLLEKKYAGRAVYQKYQRTTSVFIPLPPQKKG